LLFPQVEDFGIVAAEAQSCGCPVIAYAASGAADIVRPGTGVLISEQSAQAILDAIPQLNSTDAAQCTANASRFSEAQFDRKIRDWVQSLLTSRT
jgi:glycosyltransferase involved in cell wall biosynthesis